MCKLKPSICFVDDDQDLLDGLRRSLTVQRDVWDMHFYASPLDVLERAQITPFDLLVSDLQMPELSGQQLIAQMMAIENCSQTQYIILSGSDNFSAALNVINELNVFRFLQKPISRQGLVEAVEAALERSQSVPISHNYAETALSIITAAVIVVSKENRILYSNSAGSDLLQKRSGLIVGIDNICRASRSDDSYLLHEMIEQAINDKEDCVRWLTIKCDQDEPLLNLVAIPQGNHETGEERTVLLLSRAVENASSLNPEVLQSMFGLTPAEAVITYTITQGCNLDEAARRSGITVSSARTYLKRIFGKTGVNRQADLMKMVLSSPAAIVKRYA